MVIDQMKPYIQIETPEPPDGATHYNPNYTLCFEKIEDGVVSIWDNNEWVVMDSDTTRSGSYPIIFN